MTKFLDYLNENYTRKENLNLTEYCFKIVPKSFAEYYLDFKKGKDVVWTPETLGVISHTKAYDKKRINQILSDAKEIRKENKKSPFNVEDIPDWYLDFLKVCPGLNIFKGSITFSASTAQDAACMKPKCLDGKLYIGRYSGITPESCPIFTDKKGKIYVYEAADFRNYPMDDSKKEIERYLNQDVELLASWESIDSFLIEESERVKELFIKAPSLFGVKNCAPRK